MNKVMGKVITFLSCFVLFLNVVGPTLQDVSLIPVENELNSLMQDFNQIDGAMQKLHNDASAQWQEIKGECLI